MPKVACRLHECGQRGAFLAKGAPLCCALVTEGERARRSALTHEAIAGLMLI